MWVCPCAPLPHCICSLYDALRSFGFVRLLSLLSLMVFLFIGTSSQGCHRFLFFIAKPCSCRSVPSHLQVLTSLECDNLLTSIFCDSNPNDHLMIEDEAATWSRIRMDEPPSLETALLGELTWGFPLGCQVSVPASHTSL